MRSTRARTSRSSASSAFLSPAFERYPGGGGGGMCRSGRAVPRRAVRPSEPAVSTGTPAAAAASAVRPGGCPGSVNAITRWGPRRREHQRLRAGSHPRARVPALAGRAVEFLQRHPPVRGPAGRGVDRRPPPRGREHRRPRAPVERVIERPLHRRGVRRSAVRAGDQDPALPAPHVGFPDEGVRRRVGVLRPAGVPIVRPGRRSGVRGVFPGHGGCGAGRRLFGVPAQLQRGGGLVPGDDPAEPGGGFVAGAPPGNPVAHPGQRGRGGGGGRVRAARRRRRRSTGTVPGVARRRRLRLLPRARLRRSASSPLRPLLRRPFRVLGPGRLAAARGLLFRGCGLRLRPGSGAARLGFRGGGLPLGLAGFAGGLRAAALRLLRGGLRGRLPRLRRFAFTCAPGGGRAEFRLRRGRLRFPGRRGCRRGCPGRP